MLRQIVLTPRFSLVDLCLVLFGGCLWIVIPGIGILPVLTIAAFPCIVRLAAGVFPFRRTSLDWFVFLFLGTAWVGYWASYDQEVAWIKVWLIVLAVLLYYALAGQPTENLGWVSGFFFCVGAGISLYFFLTHDFIMLPRKVELVNWIGRLVMELRPELGLPAIHPNYVAGITAITTPFIWYAVQTAVARSIPPFLQFLILLGLGLAALAIVLATSRGVILAIATSVGIWILWNKLVRKPRWPWIQNRAVFPSLILLSLSAVILFLYLGPASVGNADSSYSSGSRSEVFMNGTYLASDFPFTGGGLGAFPGLYSYYMLGIPFFYLINSHNLFLDVAIEQGLLGGVSFFMIFLFSIWFVAQKIVNTDAPRSQAFSWFTLSALIIALVHGMVDDYLYNGNGVIFALALAGLSSSIQPNWTPASDRKLRFSFVVMLLGLAFLAMIYRNEFRAAWYANLGAVQMARVELAGFPTSQWTEPAIAPGLEASSSTLHAAIEADSMNRTANHRLGLIAMLRGDFRSAAAYLESAYAAGPNHRGIIKALGYCYVWLGDMDKAQLLLRNISESEHELAVYIGWWKDRGRQDLSVNISKYLNDLKAQTEQP